MTQMRKRRSAWDVVNIVIPCMGRKERNSAWLKINIISQYRRDIYWDDTLQLNALKENLSRKLKKSRWLKKLMFFNCTPEMGHRMSIQVHWVMLQTDRTGIIFSPLREASQFLLFIIFFISARFCSTAESLGVIFADSRSVGIQHCLQHCTQTLL